MTAIIGVSCDVYLAVRNAHHMLGANIPAIPEQGSAPKGVLKSISLQIVA